MGYIFAVLGQISRYQYHVRPLFDNTVDCRIQQCHAFLQQLPVALDIIPDSITVSPQQLGIHDVNVG